MKYWKQGRTDKQIKFNIFGWTFTINFHIYISIRNNEKLKEEMQKKARPRKRRRVEK